MPTSNSFFFSFIHFIADNNYCVLPTSFSLSVLQSYTNINNQFCKRKQIRNTAIPYHSLKKCSWNETLGNQESKPILPMRIHTTDACSNLKNTHGDRIHYGQAEINAVENRTTSWERCWLLKMKSCFRKISGTSAMKLNTWSISYFSILHLWLAWFIWERWNYQNI